MDMDFKNIHGTLFVSRVAFPPRSKDTGFPISREVFMSQRLELLRVVRDRKIPGSRKTFNYQGTQHFLLMSS